MTTFKHSVWPGDHSNKAHPGDVIWSLAHIQQCTNDPIDYYLDCDEELYEQLSVIINKQKYINHTKKFTEQKVNIDLDMCDRTDTTKCLCDVYGNVNHEIAWLDHNINNSGYNVISRNIRYQSKYFDWKHFKANIDMTNSIFVGSHHEYISFLRSSTTLKSKLEWRQTPTYIDLYNIIAGCNIFYGNGGLPCVFAHGMMKPVLLEIEMCVETPGVPIRHNIMNRSNTRYFTHYNAVDVTEL